jgi:hypothetical protein
MNSSMDPLLLALFMAIDVLMEDISILEPEEDGKLFHRNVGSHEVLTW